MFTTVIDLYATSDSAAVPTVLKLWRGKVDKSITRHDFFSKIGEAIAIEQALPSPTKVNFFIDSSKQLTPIESLRADLHRYSVISDDEYTKIRKPTKEMLDIANQLIDYLPSGIPLPRPMISEDGEIGFYWDSPGVFADLEIEENGELSVFTKVKTSPPRESYTEGLKVSTELRSGLREQLLMLVRA
ncbi:MAG TPA: hypothetical protein DD803_04180 [Alcaligenes faecalis]|nr:hypothetical protein [Alcaligenes faecalis]HBQ88643.1 hypothetical protein [Alcaligenes faecalis]